MITIISTISISIIIITIPFLAAGLRRPGDGVRSRPAYLLSVHMRDLLGWLRLGWLKCCLTTFEYV